MHIFHITAFFVLPTPCWSEQSSSYQWKKKKNLHVTIYHLLQLLLNMSGSGWGKDMAYFFFFFFFKSFLSLALVCGSISHMWVLF